MRLKSTTIRIHSLKSRLRLIWTHDKTRYFLATGLEDTLANRSYCEILISQIKTDILNQTFDTSLSKYKQFESKQYPLFPAVYQKFLQHTLYQDHTLNNHQTTQRLCEVWFNKPLDKLSIRDWEAFTGQYTGSNATIKQHLNRIKQVWKWAVDKGFIASNFWATIKVKSSKAKRIDPFTLEETNAILKETRLSFPHYYSFILFLFCTGVRTAEARALKWDCVSEDCSRVLIKRSAYYSKIKEQTKTKKDRTITLNTELQKLLNSYSRNSEFVFTSKRGDMVSKVFTRNWKQILLNAGVRYRSPYNTRHTFISHALQKGLSPLQVAAIAGNSPEIIYKHYAGFVCGVNQIPDLF